LLTDFVNKTGDDVFDGTLKQALAVKLEESPFLNVFPERKVQETLSLMALEPDERITQTVGRDICERQGMKAMMLGEIALVGSSYAITLNAVNCRSGESLARELVEAAGKEEVLGALGRAASNMRGKLGESLASIEDYNTPMEQATTSSLQALKVFSLGEAERAKGADPEAIPFYQRAIELDPDFALGYARLGASYAYLGEDELAKEHIERAFELRERVSERERFYIEGRYHRTVQGDLERSKDVYELWRRSYSRDSGPHFSLAALYITTGEHGKALEAYQAVLHLEPENGAALIGLGLTYLYLNRFEQAKAALENALAAGLDNDSTRTALYEVAFVQGDTVAMRRHAEAMKGKPGECWMRFEESWAAAVSGKLREARKLIQEAAELARQHGLKEAAGQLVLNGALLESLFGNHREAEAQLAAALALDPSLRTNVTAVEIVSHEDDIKQAQALVDELAKQSPRDTLLQRVDVPVLRSILELRRQSPSEAVQALKPALPYELGYVAWLWPPYIRGQAYVELGMGEEAAAEFQKVLDHRGVAATSLAYPFAHLGLARAYALTGDKARSRRAYENFFDLWKDADPDIAMLQEAKAEYAKLQESKPGAPTD
jgi:tetratricopeptide (TPR) repeat protein